MDAGKAARRGYPSLARWLGRAQELWNEKGRGRRSLLQQYDYFRQLSCQFPITPIRVVYTKAGSNLAAAKVEVAEALVENSLYWADAKTVSEAYYLCGVLNSETLRSEVEGYQAQGQWGPRHFDKYVFNVPIPRFDNEDLLHTRLADAARTAETVANDVYLTEGENFRRTRKRIRDALAEHGIAARLEELVTELLSKT